MIHLNPALWAGTLSSFRKCGQGKRECVVYWVGPTETPEVVDTVVHPDHAATPYAYEVDDAWLTAFWLRLAKDRKAIKAQVHTHGGAAFHSPTDDRWPAIRQEGFLSLVLPGFAIREFVREDLFLARMNDQFEWDEVSPSDFISGIPK
jgi:hypothetical protein